MISPDAIYITKNIVYSWDYLFLLVNLDIPNSIDFASDHFVRKDEFHVSLFCADKYFPNTRPELVIDAARQIVPNLNFKVTPKNKEFYLATQESQKSILVLVDVSDWNELLQKLSNKLNIQIAPFPTHITLYTLENQISVAINSFTDFSQYCQKIDLDLNLMSLRATCLPAGRSEAISCGNKGKVL